MGHGTADPIVPYHLGQKTHEFLMKNLGLPAFEGKPNVKGLSFKSYAGMEHASSQEEIQDLVQFLELVLPPA